VRQGRSAGVLGPRENHGQGLEGATLADVDPRDLKAYLEREWAATEALKRAHWAREFAVRGPQATIEAAHALFQHMRLVRPDWPSEDQRREDFAHHVELKERIDRAARAFARLAHR